MALIAGICAADFSPVKNARIGLEVEDANVTDDVTRDPLGSERKVRRGLGFCWALAGLTWLVSAFFYFFVQRLFFFFLAQQKQHQNSIQTQMFSK